ncbi:hypothetical protein DOM22_01195 [Bdellovibrio sp. ZAP7]|uniref:hypothetical protein n=1 Tax=Bdellovibrio sp. ZAP7 TaxID=2231053 RepID=UPI00115C3AE6|nr:hypothetical protein [Bdellovibrio sp. ZAP7]QDK43874.1 hypothetical protein DOM22_01195 [Bdellovibrio sp. ZAP7]
MKNILAAFILLSASTSLAGFLGGGSEPAFGDLKCVGMTTEECGKEMAFRLADIKVTDPKGSCPGFTKSCRMVKADINNKCSSVAHMFKEEDGKITTSVLQYYNNFRCGGKHDKDIPTVEELIKDTPKPKYITKADSGSGATFIQLIGSWEVEGYYVNVNALCKIQGLEKGKFVLEFFRRCQIIGYSKAKCGTKCDLSKIKAAEQYDY